MSKLLSAAPIAKQPLDLTQSEMALISSYRKLIPEMQSRFIAYIWDCSQSPMLARSTKPTLIVVQS